MSRLCRGMQVGTVGYAQVPFEPAGFPGAKIEEGG